MEPIPPTADSLERLALRGHPELSDHLRRSVEDVAALVPSLSGLSITRLVEGFSVTLVASTQQARALDSQQYLDGGPCVEAVNREAVIEADESDPLSEEVWSFFARASAASGVRSSLSIPLVEAGVVIGGVNIYASQERAFEPVVDEVARVLGAWAPGAVADADLGFARVQDAIASAAILAQPDDVVEQAVLIIARVKRVDEETARTLLADSAVRAGVSLSEVAKTIVILHE